jgi:hypothetical protein
MNAIDMIKQLRENLNESVASHWTDAELLNRLNRAQEAMVLMISMSKGNWLVEKNTFTATNGSIPITNALGTGRFSKPVYAEEVGTKRPIHFINSVREKSLYAPESSPIYDGALTAYLLKDSIELVQSSYSGSVDIWYQCRIPDLAYGTTSTPSGSNIANLGVEASPFDAYYDDVLLRVIDLAGVTSVDYVISYDGDTREATTTSSYAAGLTYGTDPLLIPAEFHPMIITEAMVSAMAKPSSSFKPEIFSYWRSVAADQRKLLEEWAADRVITPGYTTWTGGLD